MLGTINSPRHWPEDEPLTHVQLKAIDKAIPAYGALTSPSCTPADRTGEGMRIALALDDAAAMAACKPTGLRSLL